MESRIHAYQYGLRSINIVVSLFAFVLCLFLVGALPVIHEESGLVYLNVRLALVLGFSMAGIIVIHAAYFIFCCVMRGLHDLSSLRKHLVKSLFLLLLDCLWFHTLQVTLSASRLPPSFYFLYVGISFTLIMACNYLMMRFFSYLTSGKRNSLTLLILGSNCHAYGFYKLMEANRFLGYKVLGFLDNTNFGGYPIQIMAPLDEFQRVVRENVVDRCVVFLPLRSYHNELLDIIRIAEDQGVALQLMNNVFETRLGYVSLTRMGNYSGVLFDVLPLGDWRLVFKRSLDVTLSLLLLIATAPVMLAAALCIKLEDGGPVFFRQERVGYRKRTFTLYKLRTMIMGAESMQKDLEAANEMDGPVFKIRNDPRISRVGGFLRRFAIDELPQLYNVFRGDMSLVGPRPLAMRDYAGFSEDWLRRRFSVRPGLTCYWQIRKNRNDVSFHEWMRLDMEYIAHWNIAEDMKILWQTLPAVLAGTGR